MPYRKSLAVSDAISTLIDTNSRISFAVALPSKHSKYTAKVLEALIDGLTSTIELNTKLKQFSILSDNSSAFMKDF